jgi:hypothetical protein
VSETTFTCCTAPMPWPTAQQDQSCPECGTVWEREPVSLGAGARIKTVPPVSAAGDPVSGTGEWSRGSLLDDVGLLGVRVGAWNHFGYAAPEDGQAAIPPLGERGAEAIRAGHGAIEVIDEIIRDLRSLRDRLITELRTDEDVRGSGARRAEPGRGRAGGGPVTAPATKTAFEAYMQLRAVQESRRRGHLQRRQRG